MDNEILKKAFPFYKDSKGRFVCPNCFRAYRKYEDPYSVYFTLMQLQVGEIHAFVELPIERWKYWKNKISCSVQMIKRRFNRRFKIMESKGDLTMVVQRVERASRQGNLAKPRKRLRIDADLYEKFGENKTSGE